MKHRTPKKRLISMVLAACIVAGACVMPVLETEVYAVTQAQIDAKKAEQAALKRKIQTQQSKMNDLKSQQADVQSQKNALDQQQELKIQEINLVKEELEMYRQLIAEKEEEARIAQENADAALAEYKVHIRNMEEQGSNNMYLQLLFAADSMADLLARADMVGEIMEYDKRVHDNYVQARADALQAKAEYEAAVATLEVKEVELQSEIDRLEGELGNLQTELDRLRNDIDGYAKVLNEYAASEKRIDQQIKDMQEELKRQQTPPTSTGSYLWPSPSCKVVTSKYGNRTIEIYGYERFHAGIDIGAGMGSPVVAADGGTVITSTYDGGYGNYIMINHGEGRVTLYAHMSSRSVSSGATVTQGQIIGYSGSTGNSTGPHLHFEVRINGGTTNPLNYFSGYTIA